MTRMWIAIVVAALPLGACSKDAPPPAAKPTPTPAPTVEAPATDGATDAPTDTATTKPTADAAVATTPLVIDVRTQEEWDTDHIATAVLIPYDQIGDKITGVTTDKDKPIFLHCRSGGRAGKAKATLEAMGYTHVTNLGGLDDARKYLEANATPKP
ncbi:MAG: hypothetical protein GC159_03040 [Phycisphaera sp.]|nr:hypothetical protein [Phycisphaera sp.]